MRNFFHNFRRDKNYFSLSNETQLRFHVIELFSRHAYVAPNFPHICYGWSSFRYLRSYVNLGLLALEFSDCNFNLEFKFHESNILNLMFKNVLIINLFSGVFYITYLMHILSTIYTLFIFIFILYKL